MIPLVVVSSEEQRKAAQNAMERQEAHNDQYPGVNTFTQGLECVYFFYEEQNWLERLMLALMAANIPFQVEYCEFIPDGFSGFHGKRIQF